MSLEEKAKKLAETAQEQEQKIDWNARRDWWLAALNALHNQIEQWLLPLKAKGLVEVRRVPLRLTEEHIGVYAANTLVLEFSNEGIVLEPTGTLIVGAHGRVDVYRRGNRRHVVMLILAGPKESARWEIWPSRHPGDRKPLEQQTLESLLESLLDA